MSTEDKIESIKKIGKVETEKEVGEIKEAIHRVEPNKDHFEALMKQQTITKETTVQAVQEPAIQKRSLMDEVRELSRKVDSFSKVTPAQLASQAQAVIAQIDDIRTKLSTPKLEIKTATQTLLENKLSHIDESLKIALSKAGVEYVHPEKTTTPTNPIDRFLGFLTDGQSKLQQLATDVEAMHLNRKEISPAHMLAIQIKVGYIQQELEFFTSVLNKALESTKAIMNVQV